MSGTRELLEEVRNRQIASLLIGGATMKSTAKELGLSTSGLSKITDTEEFRAVLREVSDKLLVNAANTWKASVSELVGQSIKVLKAKLDENDLEAVKLVVRSLGVEKQAEVPQSGSIQIVLPDYNAPKPLTIEVESNE